MIELYQIILYSSLMNQGLKSSKIFWKKYDFQKAATNCISKNGSQIALFNVYNFQLFD